MLGASFGRWLCSTRRWCLESCSVGAATLADGGRGERQDAAVRGSDVALSERRGSYAGDGQGENIFVDHLDSSVGTIQRIDRINLPNLVERLSRIKKQNFNFGN